MMTKTIAEVGIEDLCKVGDKLSIGEAKQIINSNKAIVAAKAKAGGKLLGTDVVGKRVVKPWHPHSLHQLVDYFVYPHWDTSINGPPPYWFPSL